MSIEEEFDKLIGSTQDEVQERAKDEVADKSWQRTDQQYLDAALGQPDPFLLEQTKDLSDGDTIRLLLYSGVSTGLQVGVPLPVMIDGLVAMLLQYGFRRA